MSVLHSNSFLLDEVTPGNSIGVWGYPGVGKTTLIKKILDQKKPTRRFLTVVTNEGAEKEYDEYSPIYVTNKKSNVAPMIFPTPVVIFDDFRSSTQETWLKNTVTTLKKGKSLVILADLSNFEAIDFDINVVLGEFGRNGHIDTFGKDYGWSMATLPILKGWGLMARKGEEPTLFSFEQ